MRILYRLENFKAFADTGEIEIAPVTILCGANSSGKSSILKSILLIKQSSAERRSGLLRDAQSPPLLLNGEWTRLGSYSDTIHLKDRSSTMSFHWRAKGKMDDVERELGPRFRRRSPGAADRSLEISVQSDFKSDPSVSEELSTYLSSSEIQINQLRIKLLGNDPLVMRSGVYRLGINDLSALINRYESSFKRYTLYENVDLGKILARSNVAIETGNVRVRLAGPFIIDIDPIFDSSWNPFISRILNVAISDRSGRPGRTPTWYLDLHSAVKDFRAQFKDDDSAAKQPSTNRVGRLFNLARYVLLDVQAAAQLTRTSLAPLWRQIRYLGPLRHQPQRYYQFDDTGGIDIGVSGEFTVQVLALEATNPIKSIPIEIDVSSQMHLLPVQQFSLLDVTNYWLDLMGLPAVTPAALRQSLYELKVGKLEVSLSDVGFGVSQVLPIIVESLRAAKGDTVILEQPEIHLHPRIQAVLADFLISRSKQGIRFIVETHSDHLVKRMGRRISEATVPKLRDQIKIYFVGFEADRSVKATEVELNEFGEVMNWPVGFFDQNEDLYWTAASLRRRVGQRQNTLNQAS